MESVECLEKKLRRKTEALKQSEKRHRTLLTLLQHTTDGAFIFQGGSFLWKNRKFQELSGYMQTWSSLNDPDHVFFVRSLDEYLKRVEESESAKELPAFKLAVTCNDKRRLDVRALPIRYGDKWAIQGIVREIIAKKEGNGFNIRSLAMTVHELRTAVTIISGYHRALFKKESGPLTPLQRKILTECRLSCERLTNFAGEFLESSRMEEGRITINPQEEAIDQCITAVCRQLNPLAQEKGLTLKANLPEKSLPKGYFDRKRIEQVLINLIKNAIQFTPGGREIEVTATSNSHSEEIMKVCVADTGISIPGEERRKIFKEFMIGKNSPNGVGTGLGLAICKKIVEAHKGKIWIDPAVKSGNRFIFTLPLMKP